MNSQELDFLSNLEFFGIKLGLEQTRALFDELGNPDAGMKFIHVAGSNGKGSVCAFMESALLKCGFSTGFYSSPHLVSVSERFRINGKKVTEDTVAEYVKKVRPAVDALALKGMKATYFEVVTAIAAMMFRDAGVDFAIWEVGMGGRLDSTNIVTPEICAITGISMEHAERLGGTLGAIAFEKAGIIKPGVKVFRSRTIAAEAADVIDARASEVGAPPGLSEEIDESFKPVINLGADMKKVSQTFRFKNGGSATIPLLGAHQRRNAALAYSLLGELAEKYSFSLETAVAGMAETDWAARCEFLSEYKLILDAGHNPEGAQALADLLTEVFPGQKFDFIFGAFSEKDTYNGLAILAPFAKSFTFVHMDTMRASKTPEALERELHSVAPGLKCRAAELGDALYSGMDDAPPESWRILSGSLHLCGDALAILKNHE